MPQISLSDAELKDFEATLNHFDPIQVRAVLDEGGDTSAGDEGANTAASGPLDFGSVPAGVLVYRTEGGRLRLRLTVTEITGASYEEFELSDARFATFARAAIERLQRRA